MKFLLITLITHVPDPVSGEKKSPADRLRDVLDKAVLAEGLGFDGFAVGERHEDPFISSSPPVVLSNIAAHIDDWTVHRSDDIESARSGPRIRGLFDAGQPVRWAAGADHRQ